MLLDKLKTNPKNPRTLTDEGFNKLKNKIKNFPEMLEKRPIVYDENLIILGGNQRLRVLRELVKDDFEVKDSYFQSAKGWTEKQKREFVILDNIADGEWDWDLIANEWSDLPLEEWGLDPTNWDIQEVEEDEVPEVEEGEPDSKLGEVYELGRHRLMCGDSTKIEDVEKLMNGQKADMVFTDPPYNTGMNKKTDATWLHHMFQDNLTPEEWQRIIVESLTGMFSYTKGECVFYICIDWRNMGEVKELIQELMPVHNVIVWDKMVHGLGSDYKFTYEMIIVGKKGKPKIENRIGEDYQDVWHVQRKVGFNEDHATAKPIQLLIKPIQHASKQDDIVLDLFGGSGSTLIACEQTNRTCYMMELDPKYVDVIRKRYEKFVNKNYEKIR